MRIKSLILATFLTLPFITNVANALTPEQTTKVNEQLNILRTNLYHNELGKVFHQLPPTLINYLSGKMGLSPDKFLKRMDESFQQTIDGITFKNFKYDLSNSVEGKNAFRNYIFIPYTLDLVLDKNVQPMKAYAFALTENNKWYLVRVENEKQLNILKAVYPDLANVKLPK